LTEDQNRLYLAKGEPLVSVLSNYLQASDGGTAICDTRVAYETLRETRRRHLDGLTTENTLISGARFKLANPDILAKQLASKELPMVHPLIRAHPETGAKATWFHKSKTETITGYDIEETQVFLEKLLKETIRHIFTYCH